MFKPSRRFWTYACCAAASLSLAGFRAVPATTGNAAGTADHFNVGATHSPQLLKQLAGPATRAGPGRQVPGLAPPAAAKRAERGVDVASYQHPNGAAINWPRVHASGIGFAAVKTTEGAYYRNPYALADLARARAAGLSVVAYAFAIPNGNGARRSPVAQADYLLKYLGAMSRSVPLMLDIEYNPYGRECYGLTARAMVSWISSFNSEVKAKTGRKPILYVPASWWAACTGGRTGFGHRQLWVPDYTTAPRPLLPAGWKTWSFWQYTSIGTVRGIQAAGHTDLDRANPAIPPVLGNQ
jgi:GH25 family lysozyme M1 (1,4-beta-N-acetylmuramidase)